MKRKTHDSVPYTKLLTQVMTDLALASTSVGTAVKDARQTIILCARWLDTLFRVVTSNGTILHLENINLLVNSLAGLLITLLNSSSGLAALKISADQREDSLNVAVRQVIQASMTTFPDVSMQLLSVGQKHPAFDDSLESETNNAQAAEMAALTFENNIAIAQVVPTRMATFALIQDKVSLKQHF